MLTEMFIKNGHWLFHLRRASVDLTICSFFYQFKTLHQLFSALKVKGCQGNQ